MLPALLLAGISSAAEPACAPGTPGGSPKHFEVRGHSYDLVGACGTLPVYFTPLTDSTFLDRAEAPMAHAILVTGESRDPTSAADDWPAPAGNLYFSYPFPGTLDQARQAISGVVGDWWAGVAPDLAITEGWDGAYGGHRASDGRFVTGLALEKIRGFAAIGVDLHVGATPEAYGPAASEHVSAQTLTGAPQDLEATRWRVLAALNERATARVRRSLYDEAAAGIFDELARHGITDLEGEPIRDVGVQASIPGFAWNHGRGAIVERATTLAACDAFQAWPEHLERGFVVATGRLEWLPRDVEVDDPPEFDPHDWAVLQLVGCEVQPGPRTEDVPAERWKALRAVGIDAALGQPVQISGELTHSAFGPALRVEAETLLLDGCHGSGLAMVEGTLGYRPPRYLPGVAPDVDGLVKVTTGVPNHFSIEGCEVAPAMRD